MGNGSYEWRFDSGRVCLDLVAVAPDGPEGLGRWLVAAGLGCLVAAAWMSRAASGTGWPARGRRKALPSSPDVNARP